MSTKYRVMIADDSTVFRSLIRAALDSVPEIEIVGSASNGRLALDALKIKPVDLLITDIEMPEMTGLELLAEMQRLNIRPKSLVFSAFTKRGAEATLSALSLGASDFLTKPDGVANPGVKPGDLIKEALLPKIQQFLNTRHAPAPLVSLPRIKPQAQSMLWNLFNPKVLVIASSTGGPVALEKLFSYLKGPFTVPVLMVQHMPPLFTASLAERLTRTSGIPVREAVNGERIQAGQVYLAPGDFHLEVEGPASIAKLNLNQKPQRQSVRPCADYLFETAAQVYGSQILGVVLTGMGADGRDGAVQIKKSGGAVMIQEKESCVVFGMPGAVMDAGAYDKMDTLEGIAEMFSQIGICEMKKKAG